MDADERVFNAVRDLKFCKILNENRKILSKIYSKIINRAKFAEHFGA